MATLKSTEVPAVATRVLRASPRRQRTNAGLLQCLVVSPTDERRQMIRSAAEAQSWDAIVCSDAGEFMRCVFRHRVPLIVVDLQCAESGNYEELRRAAEDANGRCDGLLLISGGGQAVDEEVWARSLGAWSYLPHADNTCGFEHVLKEAQEAIARREELHRARTGRTLDHFNPP